MNVNTRGRVPLFLQKALKEEIEKITDGMTFRKPRSDKRIKLQVYEQALPVPSKDDSDFKADESITYDEGEYEEAVFRCPWCVVKVESGEIQGPNANVEVLMELVFGVFDDDPNNQGHYDIENLIWKVVERFAKDPLLASQYTCKCDFKFGHQDEDTYPYYFGALTMTFGYPGIRRESGGQFI